MMVVVLMKMINLVVEMVVFGKWPNVPRPFHHQPKKRKKREEKRKDGLIRLDCNYSLEL